MIYFEFSTEKASGISRHEDVSRLDHVEVPDIQVRVVLKRTRSEKNDFCECESVHEEKLMSSRYFVKIGAGTQELKGVLLLAFVEGPLFEDPSL